jgi:hypothetical protein
LWSLSTEVAVEIKKIGIWSLGKVLGVVYALLGLVIGLFVALIALLGAVLGAGSAGTEEGVAGALGFGVAGGVGALVVLPLMYGFLGLIAGLLTALVYNIVAALIGGIKVELTEDGEVMSRPEPPRW